MNPNEGFNKITVYNLSLHQSVQSNSKTQAHLHFQYCCKPINPTKPFPEKISEHLFVYACEKWREEKLAGLASERLAHLFQL